MRQYWHNRNEILSIYVKIKPSTKSEDLYSGNNSRSSTTIILKGPSINTTETSNTTLNFLHIDNQPSEKDTNKKKIYPSDEYYSISIVSHYSFKTDHINDVSFVKLNYCTPMV